MVQCTEDWESVRKNVFPSGTRHPSRLIKKSVGCKLKKFIKNIVNFFFINGKRSTLYGLDWNFIGSKFTEISYFKKYDLIMTPWWSRVNLSSMGKEVQVMGLSGVSLDQTSMKFPIFLKHMTWYWPHADLGWSTGDFFGAALCLGR